MISGLFLAPSLNIMKTRANFQACENIPVVMETFILKGKLELIVVQPPLPSPHPSRRVELLTKTRCIIARYPRMQSSISLHAASVKLYACSIAVIQRACHIYLRG